MQICGFMAFKDSVFHFRNGLAFHKVFGIQQSCGKTSFIQGKCASDLFLLPRLLNFSSITAIRFVLDPSYQNVQMSEIKCSKSPANSQAFVQLWIGLEENEQAHFAMDIQRINESAGLDVVRFRILETS